MVEKIEIRFSLKYFKLFRLKFKVLVLSIHLTLHHFIYLAIDEVMIQCCLLNYENVVIFERRSEVQPKA